MTAAKITISMPAKLYAQVTKAVDEGIAESVSAYVTRAVTQQVKDDDWQELFREIYAETGGPPTLAERNEARRTLGLPLLKRNRRT